MGRIGWSAVRRSAWALVAIGVVGLGMWVVTMALGARAGADFERWVGWANLLALPTGALGAALVVIDRITRPPASARPSHLDGPADSTPGTASTIQVQNVTAHGGSAQGVMNGDIHHHHHAPPGAPSRSPATTTEAAPDEPEG